MFYDHDREKALREKHETHFSASRYYVSVPLLFGWSRHIVPWFQGKVVEENRSQLVYLVSASNYFYSLQLV